MTPHLVLMRWLRARREVEASMWAARSVVVRRQLDAMRGSYPT